LQLSAAGWFSLCIPEKVIGGSLLTLSHYQPKLIEKGIRKTPRHYRMSRFESLQVKLLANSRIFTHHLYDYLRTYRSNNCGKVIDTIAPSSQRS